MGRKGGRRKEAIASSLPGQTAQPERPRCRRAAPFWQAELTGPCHCGAMVGLTLEHGVPSILQGFGLWGDHGGKLTSH